MFNLLEVNISCASIKNNYLCYKGKGIYIALFLILLFAFFIRFYGFNHPHLHTFDEGVYANLGYQLSQDITDYNTQGIYRETKKSGRNLPAHYNAPLFCHPPLFSLMISCIYRFIPFNFEAAHWISLFFGMLTIVAVFFLAKILFSDNRIALFSSFILSIDANHIICSEKIWLNTTEAFFISTALLCFILFLRRERLYLGILTGIFVGLSMLTKLTGSLILAAFFIYVFLFDARLFKKLSFWSILISTFLIYLPWLIWEISIYGSGILNSNIFYVLGLKLMLKHRFNLLILSSIIVILRIAFSRTIFTNYKVVFSKIFQGAIIAAIACIFIFPSRFFNASGILDLRYFPINGWVGINSESPFFYAQRFLELSPLFIFSYLSFLTYKKEKKVFRLLFIYLICIIGFFTLWNNFHMRYVLSADSSLAILASFLILTIWDWFAKKGSKRFILYKFCFLFIIGFLILKTAFVSTFMALPNLTCYY